MTPPARKSLEAEEVAIPGYFSYNHAMTVDAQPIQIAEVFYSIQGEGMLTGLPSAFIRTSGCNLRCSWCDTKYASWSPEGEDATVEDILRRVDEIPAKHCVITGGEPTVVPGMDRLTQGLRARGKHITIETNGTLAPPDLDVDLASVSPKLSNSVAPSDTHPVEAAMQARDKRWNLDALRQWIDNYAFQLKFVVASERDLDEIHELLEQVAREIPPEQIMLMPEGTDVETIRQRDGFLVDICKQYGYRYCQRLHIALFGNTRGT